MALTSPVRAARPSTKRPWSLRERLDERDITELITAYRDGATSASLATTHRVSLTSVNASYAPRCPPRTLHPRTRKGHTDHHVSVIPHTRVDRGSIRLTV